MTPIGIIGASGYTGAELLRICAEHPGLEVVFATADSQAGKEIAELYPSLAGRYWGRRYETWDPQMLAGVEAVFLALPHGASQDFMGDVLAAGVAVVDLGADFRLRDPQDYQRWYGEPHREPDLLDRFAYGLPELHRAEIRTSRAVANPGCYPTAATLALAPLVRADLIGTEGIIVDAVSGVSGAGRPAKPTTTFCTVDEDVTAYGLLTHRHTAEMDANLGATVLFTPHLVPMNRGILATCHARPTRGGISTEDLLGVLSEAYAEEPFVVVSQRPPSTKACLGSNAAHLTARFDERTGSVLVLSAIDNLGKGASGAAVQNMNLVLGIPETTGLSVTGVYP
jgi:N-acetyl-gamma-glutamyl-phosphate reductase